MKTQLLDKMAKAAIGFASDDMGTAGRMISAGLKDGRGVELRRKYAARRLKSAKEQLTAAIVLLEGEL